MRIAQVSPLYESVPPKLYGGTERIVSYLTEELVKQGHDVTLFASGDSVTQANLVPITDTALRLNDASIDLLAHHILMIERVFQSARDFDIIHWHIDYMHFPVSRRQTTPHITTLHGRLDIPDLAPLYREYAEMPVISISDSQRTPLPWANWQGTVYHGLPEDLYSPHPEPGEYLAFLGRISPEKRLDRAIEIARRVGMPLKVAAKVDKADQEYFEKEIEPLLDHSLVEFIGEIGDGDGKKEEFLGNAHALLFPIDWPEPFGLVMIEAMACGTPVVAFREGSVTEVLDHGITGFICDDMDEAVEATRSARTLSREQIRSIFETRFSAARMARDYVAIYERLAAKSRIARPIPLTGLKKLAPYPLEAEGTGAYTGRPA